MAKTTETTVSTNTVETKFPKDKILTSATYAKRKDLVNALLEDGKEYALAEVDSMIKKYMKGKVK